MSWEFRVGWAASSNASFQGHSDWEPYEGEADDEDDIIDELSRSNCSYSLETAIAVSGFEWFVELRQLETGNPFVDKKN